MTDAVDLQFDLDGDDEVQDPLHHFTFWRKNSASRLDRFYVKGEPFHILQSMNVLDPAHDSDHQEVRINICTRKTERELRTGKLYPISSGRPHRIREAIERGLIPLLDDYERTADPVGKSDALIGDIQPLLKRTRIDDRKQASRYFRKLRADTHVPKATRPETIAQQQKSSPPKSCKIVWETTRKFVRGGAAFI
ncbi:hypothetical protein GN244_ATG15203 [Phytophthora infestans]|uniref:Endonuclease/exonuclease/phosphatase domain-containing protein n=1 Tax=Phytophthora infestans TaxID=4787 RepID=A0A833SMI4_PHYIN|nr:hypothetical protein GN244_ATG15203 [Phytophthora infestans]